MTYRAVQPGQSASYRHGDPGSFAGPETIAEARAERVQELALSGEHPT